MSVAVLCLKKHLVKPSDSNPTGKIAFLNLIEDERFDLQETQIVRDTYRDNLGYQYVVVGKNIRFMQDDEPLVEGKFYIRQRRNKVGQPMFVSQYLGIHFDQVMNCDYVAWGATPLSGNNPSEIVCVVSKPKHIDDFCSFAEVTF